MVMGRGFFSFLFGGRAEDSWTGASAKSTPCHSDTGAGRPLLERKDAVLIKVIQIDVATVYGADRKVKALQERASEWANPGVEDSKVSRLMGVDAEEDGVVAATGPSYCSTTFSHTGEGHD